MKNKLLTFFILMSVLLTGCHNHDSFIDVEYKTSITLIKNEHYHIVEHNQQTSEKNVNVAYLTDGTSISYVLEVENNYYISGTDYQYYHLIFIGENCYSLTLEEIKYSIRVTLFVEKVIDDDPVDPPDIPDDPPIDPPDIPDDDPPIDPPTPQIKNKITYDANGGEYILYNGHQANEVIYSLAHHPRPNTSIGTDIMSRDGYTLFGWNTKADGSGEHIGLGSRYLDLNHDSFTLYAEWIKNDDSSLYQYLTVNKPNKHIEIYSYIGNKEVVSIPEYINDLPVTTIKSEAFKYKNVTKVYLPKTITVVEDNAFEGSNLEELYMFDNITTISDQAFTDCLDFKVLHINAIQKPKFVTADKHSPFADKIDNIIVNKDKKKIVIAGGSGAYYSIDACELNNLYEDYEVYNVAINGWFNNYVQLDIIKRFINSGDILLHSIESCGEYQFLTRNDMGSLLVDGEYDTRLFNCLELNYDLLSYVDIRNVTHLFDVFQSFNKSRAGKKDEQYTDYTLFADERGDYSKDPAIRKKVAPHIVYDDNNQVKKENAITEEGSIDRGCYTYEGLQQLDAYYLSFIDKGVDIYFAFSCVNIDSLLEEEKEVDNIYDFERDIVTSINNQVIFINHLIDVLFPYTYFADSDWHLDYEHALSYTHSIALWMGDL